ncbi:MAG: site-2 protease family protein [Deltaproteobacteria bacterium]|nr:site-2 protease family protein [Deltaproteobacteria bacterium]
MSGSPPPARGVFGGSAWRIGHVAGIEIAVDHSWLLIFALITFSLGGQFSAAHESWSPPVVWFSAIVTSLLFFASIVLHELGHSLTAQRLGVGVASITLFVFGGMAQLRSQPKRPRDEVLIALAGPLVSIVLGLGFSAMAGAIGESSDGPLSAILAWLGRINVVLAIFNVVPGIPLDGGRVLRGLVWALTGSFQRATKIAAASGSLVAYTLIFLGIVSALLGGQVVGGLWLVFIGWFLLSAARASVGQVVVEGILARVRSESVMEPVGGLCLTGRETVADLIVESVLRHGYRTFYVVDPVGALLGIVTLGELAGVAADDRAHTLARSVMTPIDRLHVLRPENTGWDALQTMAEFGVNQLPVVRAGRLIGAVTRERLLALVQAGSALHPRRD